MVGFKFCTPNSELNSYYKYISTYIYAPIFITSPVYTHQIATLKNLLHMHLETPEGSPRLRSTTPGHKPYMAMQDVGRETRIVEGDRGSSFGTMGHLEK